MNNELTEFLKEERAEFLKELEKLEEPRKRSLLWNVGQHPIKRLLMPNRENDYQVLHNVCFALRNINNSSSENVKQWLKNPRLKKRLLHINDYSESSSALSELIAFGYLLNIPSFSIEPVKKEGADFRFLHNRSSFIVEVHSKQANNEEILKLQKFSQEKFSQREGGQTFKSQKSLDIANETTISPFGELEKREISIENAISKVRAIKGKEHQMEKNVTSVLWLDFQDATWDGILNVEQAQPILYMNNMFYSGIFWYSFYGWKNAPIMQHYMLGGLDKIKMEYEGRFNQPTKIDAAIISLPRDTIILENPLSNKPISPSLWAALFQLKSFNIMHSYINYPAKTLLSQIELDKQTINELANYKIV